MWLYNSAFYGHKGQRDHFVSNRNPASLTPQMISRTVCDNGLRFYAENVAQDENIPPFTTDSRVTSGH